jgi:hypothetical protein
MKGRSPDGRFRPGTADAPAPASEAEPPLARATTAACRAKPQWIVASGRLLKPVVRSAGSPDAETPSLSKKASRALLPRCQQLAMWHDSKLPLINAQLVIAARILTQFLLPPRSLKGLSAYGVRSLVE